MPDFFSEATAAPISPTSTAADPPPPCTAAPLRRGRPRPPRAVAAGPTCAQPARWGRPPPCAAIARPPSCAEGEGGHGEHVRLPPGRPALNLRGRAALPLVRPPPDLRRVRTVRVAAAAACDRRRADLRSTCAAGPPSASCDHHPTFVVCRRRGQAALRLVRLSPFLLCVRTRPGPISAAYGRGKVDLADLNRGRPSSAAYDRNSSPYGRGYGRGRSDLANVRRVRSPPGQPAHNLRGRPPSTLCDRRPTSIVRGRGRGRPSPRTAAA